MKLLVVLLLFVANLLWSSNHQTGREHTASPPLPKDQHLQMISQDEAIQLVRERMKELNDPRYYGEDTAVRFDHLDDEQNFVIQVYNFGQGQTATLNWYTVDKEIRELIPMFQEN